MTEDNDCVKQETTLSAKDLYYDFSVLDTRKKVILAEITVKQNEVLEIQERQIDILRRINDRK